MDPRPPQVIYCALGYYKQRFWVYEQCHQAPDWLERSSRRCSCPLLLRPPELLLERMLTKTVLYRQLQTEITVHQLQTPVFWNRQRRRPHTADTRRLKTINRKYQAAVYCICRGIDLGELMLGCDQCKKWYHPPCMFPAPLVAPDPWYCPLCKWMIIYL